MGAVIAGRNNLRDGRLSWTPAVGRNWRGAGFLKHSVLFLVFSLPHMAMATTLALPDSPQCNGGTCRSTNRYRVEPAETGWTTRIFVRRDCLEPPEGSAHFDDLKSYRSPPPLSGEALRGQDCEPADDDDGED